MASSSSTLTCRIGYRLAPPWTIYIRFQSPDSALDPVQTCAVRRVEIDIVAFVAARWRSVESPPVGVGRVHLPGLDRAAARLSERSRQSRRRGPSPSRPPLILRQRLVALVWILRQLVDAHGSSSGRSSPVLIPRRRTRPAIEPRHAPAHRPDAGVNPASRRSGRLLFLSRPSTGSACALNLSAVDDQDGPGRSSG
jgi:hypothetical protein